MLISTKSWHYRFMNFMGLRPHWRDNLCSYIRGFVFSVIKLCFWIIVGLFALAVAILFLYSMGYTLLTGLLGLDTTSLQWTIGTACWVWVSLAGIGYVLHEMHGRRVYKPAGPFKQYVMDRHNKVCRMIQFN